MNTRSTLGTLAAISTMLLASHTSHSQVIAVSPGADAPVRWHSDTVVFIAGLPDVKPDSPGSLRLTPSTVSFVSKNAKGQIPFDRITAVFIGDERVATGGTTAKVARHIPIYGFGAAVGAVTNKKVDLLTFEYRDDDGGYHGAVFAVPKTQAALAQQQLSPLTSNSPVVPMTSCSHVVESNTILVTPIISTDVELPAEYRVLLYEQLVEQLKLANGSSTIYRVGSASAPCAAKSLQLSVTAFKKGNEALRASTGPVGMFVGGTSVTFHVSLTDRDGAMIFEKALKESKRGDGDSLAVARNLAKSVSKRLAKAKQFAPPAATHGHST